MKTISSRNTGTIADIINLKIQNRRRRTSIFARFKLVEAPRFISMRGGVVTRVYYKFPF